MATRQRGSAPLVQVAPKYQLYSEWLAEDENGGYNIPADHLQIAVRNYGSFQKSDANRAANEEAAAAREESKPAKATRPTKATKAAATKTAGRRAAVEEEESAAPAKTTARKAPAKRAKGAASF